MNQSGPCPDDEQLRAYAEGRLGADAFAVLATHVRNCSNCRAQVLGGEPTIEDDGPRSFRFDTTGDTLDDAEQTNPRTDYDATLHKGDGDSAVAYLFPDRQGENLGWLGNYEIEYELGRGGMGIVFKGFDPHLRRVVAVKVMAPQLAVNDRARQRFTREARAVATINHPNVVTIHAVSEHRNVPYLVMEYVAGESLEHRIRHRRPLPPVEIVRIAAQIADGLAAAHAVGTIHRDVKPANVMLENTVDRVKISDFGLAQIALDCAELTPTDQVLGTPSYMSPEQVEGKEVDPRSDLFSLGCVIYAMVAGHSPFIGSHLLDVVRRVSDFDPARLDEVDPNVPKALADLVGRLLEKEPGDRLQSAEQTAEALRDLLTDGSLDSSRKLAPLLSPALGLVSREPPRLRTAGLLLGLVAAIGSSGWWYWVHPWSTADPSTTPASTIDPSTPSASDSLLVTVSQSGPAHYSDLREAVSRAKPGSTIRILDAGRYEGPIILNNSRPTTNLTIESPRGATLFAKTAIRVLVIQNVSNVTVRGLKIDCTNDQHGVALYMNVPGTTLENLQVDQPSSSQRSAVYLAKGTHGTPEAPVRLVDLDVTSGELGVALIGEEGSAVSSVKIERGRFRGAGTLITVEGVVHDLAISDSLFIGGMHGLVLKLTNPKPIVDVLVRNNTFFGLNHWIYISSSQVEPKNLTVARNLILDCNAFEIAGFDPRDVGPLWFKDDVWRTDLGGDVEHVARAVDKIPLLSTVPTDPEFLRPTDPATVSVGNDPTDASAFAGAIRPGRQASPPPSTP